MNILLTNFHPYDGGGHTTYLIYLFNYFSHVNDINLSIACPKSSKLYRLCKKINPNMTFGIDFPSKPKEFKNVVKNTRTLSSLIKTKNIDIVHVNGNPDHKMVIYCKVFYKLNYKIIRTKHDSKDIKENLFSTIQYKYFMDKMIVVSRFQNNSINNKSLENKTIVIHNGVDLQHFKPLKKDLHLLSQYKIKNDDLVFVSVAGTALYKGWQHLVESVSKLKEDQRSKIKDQNNYCRGGA